MILRDITLRQRMQAHERRIEIDPMDESCIQPASIELHLAAEILEIDPQIIGDGVIVDALTPDPAIWRKAIIGPEGYVLKPGECILAGTVERVSVPDDLVGELWGKSSRARIFLMIHCTAGYADPGFSGTWTLEIKNLLPLPVRLYAGMKIAQMKYAMLDGRAQHPYGSPSLNSHYQHQNGAVVARFGVLP